MKLICGRGKTLSMLTSGNGWLEKLSRKRVGNVEIGFTGIRLGMCFSGLF